MKHRINVGAIITIDNKVLLVKHVHPVTKKEWWVPPGGLEEKDQNIMECSIREAYEEKAPYSYRSKGGFLFFVIL